MGYYISASDQTYYIASNPAHVLDTAVPQRPDPTYVWNGIAWAVDSTKQAAATRLSTDGSEFASFIADPTITTLVNQTKAQWITWANSNLPTLTAAEQTRLGTLFWVVSVGVRKFMR